MYDEKTAPTSDDWPPYDHGIDVDGTAVDPKQNTAVDPSLDSNDPNLAPEDWMTGVPFTKEDSDNRQFETGAQRDTAEGKLRMSLVPQEPLKRVMKRYLDGAEKYGENNWMKGMPMSVFYDCAHRHLEAWWRGENSEDHAAAVVWNMLCAMWTENNNQVEEDLTEDRHKFPR